MHFGNSTNKSSCTLTLAHLGLVLFTVVKYKRIGFPIVDAKENVDSFMKKVGLILKNKIHAIAWVVSS